MIIDPLDEPKVLAWKRSLTDSGCTINKIEPLNYYNRPNGELLFALLKADVTAPDGNKLPPIIFIRGHACIVVPLLENRTTGEKRYLMVQQRRVATGAMTLEFPAGMLDRNIKNPVQTALKELKEETGLDISGTDLFALHDKPLYSSPGASDEGIYYYGCHIKLDNYAYNLFEGRITGYDSQYEKIHVTLKAADEAKQEMTSLHAHCGLTLFEEYFSKHLNK